MWLVLRETFFPQKPCGRGRLFLVRFFLVSCLLSLVFVLFSILLFSSSQLHNIPSTNLVPQLFVFYDRVRVWCLRETSNSPYGRSWLLLVHLLAFCPCLAFTFSFQSLFLFRSLRVYCTLSAIFSLLQRVSQFCSYLGCVFGVEN